jgi:hypothetical protein
MLPLRNDLLRRLRSLHDVQVTFIPDKTYQYCPQLPENVLALP